MLIFERFEGNTAILEKDGQSIKVSSDCLSGDVREGDVLTEINGRYCPDKCLTEKRREQIKKLQDSLWE